MTNKKTLILGIGNNILTDDGIGSRLVSDITNLGCESKIYIMILACCGGLEIVEYIKDMNE